MEDLPKTEIFFISKYNTYNNGYNETKGGDGWLGKSHTNISKKKISKSKISKSIHTEESRAKISDSLKGRIFSDEHKKKISESKIGDKNPMNNPKYRKRVSDGKKGFIIPENIKAKISKSCLEKNINAKKYNIITPDGDKIVIFNLSKYCRQNKLSNSHMSAVANGKRRHHKGYKVTRYG